MNVYARWRPLPDQTLSNQVGVGTKPSSSLLAVSITSSTRGEPQRWTSPAAFTAVLNPEDDNSVAYARVVEPTVPNIIQGGSCSFFAYGHSGSGKTHTIIGYDYENDHQLGLSLAAARNLFAEIEEINKSTAQQSSGFGISLSLFELRHKKAYDLLNGRTECHVRQGPDGRVHIRGETETLEGGKVRVRPVTQLPCWSLSDLKATLLRGLALRAVGTSTIHDESSRTHAVLEMEIISKELVDAREALIERQSELVPVGKHATDVKVSEQTKGVILLPDGKWKPNPDYQVNQALIDECDAAMAECERRVKEAEDAIDDIYKSASHACLGGKMLFIDLAGAEFQDEKNNALQAKKQTAKERQEARQINTDLLALKEVIRAWSSTNNQSRIPFRSSTLTMVLREHFLAASKGNSGMIVTVSPAMDQYAATVNSLKYGALAGAA